MLARLCGSILAAAFVLVGPHAPLSPFAVPAALADDDDGGGGGFSRGFGGGFSGAKTILGLAPRILRGIKVPGSRPVKRRRAAAAPIRKQERELVAVGLTPSDIDRLTALGFTVLAERQIATFGASVTRLQIPPKQSLSGATNIVAQEASGVSVAANDRYRGLSRVVYAPAGDGCGERCEAFELTAWTKELGRCTAKARIGVVDTGADLDHPTLSGTPIVSKVFRSKDRAPSDTDHGTAVLSLLVGKPDSDVVGLAHGAEVLHADAFHGSGDSSATDVFDLVAAIDWLLSERVEVLNLSFSGPDNPLVERAILAAQNKGVQVIAAVGRPDRGNLAGYPARYDGVIAVSAVDNRMRLSRHSIRGGHVAFAAPGVGLTVAHGKNGLRKVDGTSFAAPFVVAAYAMSAKNGRPRSEVSQTLARSALDLGAPGRDNAYGWGLLQYSAIPGC
ncbi:MAG: S8 family serine peptidase [Hyphomicrobium sp.]